MINKIVLFIFLSILISCNGNSDIPRSVRQVLDKAGRNKSELVKVINHYKEQKDAAKLQAAYFLIGNMEQQSYIKYIVADSQKTNLHFNVLDYPDYRSMVAAWDSIESIRGQIKNIRDTVIYDYETVTADYLINNIDLAFKAWRENAWAKHINFNQFCEYILPYRSTNEPLEDWRSYFYKKYQWVKDSVANKGDPVEAAILINNDIKSWFSFDSRFYRQSTDQGLSEMLANKMGRCEDMTNLAIYAMRSVSIPVMSDFTPYWAKSGNNHAWNALIDTSGNVVIFMGGGANPGEYDLNQAKAKVYRKTFAKQPFTLAEIKKEGEKAPPYINRNNIIDVTRDYVPVADVHLSLEKDVPDSTNFAYICVFNSGEWKAIHWSKIGDNNKVNFTDMGLDIVYLPAFYNDEKIVPAGTPFILTNEGQTVLLKADDDKRITLRLLSTTRKVTQNTTDNIEQAFFEAGRQYELFYWDESWKSIGKQRAGKGALIFKEVPANALYWLVAEKSKKQERIFVVDEDGKQVWY